MIRCGLIARVACTEQDAESGALLSQIQRLRDYIMSINAEAGFEFVTETRCYKFAGVRGYRSGGPSEFDQILRDAKSSVIDRVVVESVDRVSRTIPDLVRFLSKLNGYGISFVSLRESLNTTTPDGKVLVGALEAIHMADFSRRTGSDSESVVALKGER